VISAKYLVYGYLQEITQINLSYRLNYQFVGFEKITQAPAKNTHFPHVKFHQQQHLFWIEGFSAYPVRKAFHKFWFTFFMLQLRAKIFPHNST
jgi:hypothetical protein